MTLQNRIIAAAFSGLAPLITLALLFTFSGCGGPIRANDSRAVSNTKVEIGCGECLLGMAGNGCHLAIRFDEKAYYVDGDFKGAHIDDHGDAHADDGLCNSVRRAIVSGTIKHGRFKASEIKVLEPGSE